MDCGFYYKKLQRLRAKVRWVFYFGIIFLKKTRGLGPRAGGPGHGARSTGPCWTRGAVGAELAGARRAGEEWLGSSPWLA